MSGEAAGPVRSVGWIGTGRMGHAMVSRLLGHGLDVLVWNRTRAKAEDLEPLGARLAAGIPDLAGQDAVFTMVSADRDLLAVTLGEGGVLRQPRAPRYLVDASTVSAGTSQQVRTEATAVGTTVLAAPVSGNAKAVAAGQLSMAVSGPHDAFEAMAPLLERICRSVSYVGEGEVARLVKIAHNVFLGVLIQSLAEVTLLAEQGGVSRKAFLDFINSSVLGSVFTRYKTPALVNLDLTPTFTTALLAKDLDLGLSAAGGTGMPMPLAALAHQLVVEAINRGHAGEDFAALLIEQAHRAGIELQPENTDVTDGLAANGSAVARAAR